MAAEMMGKLLLLVWLAAVVSAVSTADVFHKRIDDVLKATDRKNSGGSSAVQPLAGTDGRVQLGSPGQYKVTWNRKQLLDERLPLPNVNYLGAGYDLVHGNPQGEDGGKLDPGFRAPVVQLQFTRMCPDRKYLCPAGSFYRLIMVCNHAQRAKQIKTEDQLKQSLKAEVKVQARLGNPMTSGEFQASAGYRQFVDDKSKSNLEYFQAKTMCYEYSVDFFSRHFEKTPPPLTDEFLFAVGNLPVDKSTKSAKSEYLEFINQFGSHYVSGLSMGAKRIQTTKVKASEAERLSEQGIDLSLAASFSSVYGSGGGGASMQAEQYKKFKRAAKHREEEETVIGGTAMKEWQAWASTVDARPMPIQYTLRPLTELLAEKRFGSDGQKKAKLLEEFYREYSTNAIKSVQTQIVQRQLVQQKQANKEKEVDFAKLHPTTFSADAFHIGISWPEWVHGIHRVTDGSRDTVASFKKFKKLVVQVDLLREENLSGFTVVVKRWKATLKSMKVEFMSATGAKLGEHTGAVNTLVKHSAKARKLRFHFGDGSEISIAEIHVHGTRSDGPPDDLTKTATVHAGSGSSDNLNFVKDGRTGQHSRIHNWVELKLAAPSTVEEILVWQKAPEVEAVEWYQVAMLDTNRKVLKWYQVGGELNLRVSGKGLRVDDVSFIRIQPNTKPHMYLQEIAVRGRRSSGSPSKSQAGGKVELTEDTVIAPAPIVALSAIDVNNVEFPSTCPLDYVVLKTDVNRNCPGSSVHLCYKRGSHADPIKELEVMRNNRAKCSRRKFGDNTVTTFTNTRRPADTNQGGKRKGGRKDKVYICQAKISNKKPILQIALFEKQTISGNDWTVEQTSLSAGSTNSRGHQCPHSFIGVSRRPTVPALVQRFYPAQ